MRNPKHLCEKCWEKKNGEIKIQEGVTTTNMLTCEECGQRNEYTLLDEDVG